MRVRSLSVRKLFGHFDHTIPLNLDERITIIHGPNGYGKTAVLRLVEAAFHFDVATLRTYPFEALRVDLNDGSYLELSLEEPHRVSKKSYMLYVLGQGEQVLAHDRWHEDDSSSRAEPFLTERYKAAHQELSRAPSAGEMLKILEEDRPLQGQRLFLRLWLSLVPVHIVFVERLLTPKKSLQQLLDDFPGNRSEKASPEMTFEQTVLVYSDAFRATVRNVQEDYARVSQYLDRTFPMRVVEAMNMQLVSGEQLERALRSLQDQQERLHALGILPREDNETGIPAALGSVDNAIRKVLLLYVHDMERKLAIFEGLASRMDLLQEIINQRFQFKRLKIDAERGFVFESDTGQELPPTALSSGEQHQLIMVYECLFRIKKDALLLIDEPELSLHVSWQVEFLRDLKRIIEIRQFDVLIATHSPQVIHDRWDLTVELQPPSGRPILAATDASVAGAETALE